MSGRQNWARGRVNTTCRNGHRKGPGHCRVCMKAKNRRYYVRMRAGLVMIPSIETARRAIKQLESIE